MCLFFTQTFLYFINPCETLPVFEFLWFHQIAVADFFLVDLYDNDGDESICRAEFTYRFSCWRRSLWPSRCHLNALPSFPYPSTPHIIFLFWVQVLYKFLPKFGGQRWLKKGAEIAAYRLEFVHDFVEKRGTAEPAEAKNRETQLGFLSRWRSGLIRHKTICHLCLAEQNKLSPVGSRGKS